MVTLQVVEVYAGLLRAQREDGDSCPVVLLLDDDMPPQRSGSGHEDTLLVLAQRTKTNKWRTTIALPPPHSQAWIYLCGDDTDDGVPDILHLYVFFMHSLHDLPSHVAHALDLCHLQMVWK